MPVKLHFSQEPTDSNSGTCFLLLFVLFWFVLGFIYSHCGECLLLQPSDPHQDRQNTSVNPRIRNELYTLLHTHLAAHTCILFDTWVHFCEICPIYHLLIYDKPCAVHFQRSSIELSYHYTSQWEHVWAKQQADNRVIYQHCVGSERQKSVRKNLPKKSEKSVRMGKVLAQRCVG